MTIRSQTLADQQTSERQHSGDQRFTPGPWRVGSGGWTASGGHEGGHIEAVDMRCGTYSTAPDGSHTHEGRRKEIALYYTQGHGISCREEGRANAHLIAAAPDMLAALEQIAIVCTANMDRSCDHRMALDFVRQVANDASAAAEGDRPAAAQHQNQREPK